jgi:hypothetical protein
MLGPLDGEPSIWAECLFVDVIADLAVLGPPDKQELILLANGCIKQDHHIACQRYCRMHAITYGKVWRGWRSPFAWELPNFARRRRKVWPNGQRDGSSK